MTMLDARYDDVVTDALDHWIDHHSRFSKQRLLASFPWMTESLAEEEIGFWLDYGYVNFDGDQYRRTAYCPINKVLFLDVDGVLNHSKADETIDSVCLRNFARVIESTGALIVLISSWKEGWFKKDKNQQYEDANYLDRRLAEVGLKIFDKASRFTGHRVISVIDYVMKLNASSWAILDDEGFRYEDSLLRYNAVVTSYDMGGLTIEAASKAIALLNDID